MGAKDFTELDAWRLSKELQLLVLPLLDRPRFAGNRKLREQLDDSAASAPRNIAEGYGRFAGTEFAQFLKVAIASLFETRNHLLDARDRGYITGDEQHSADIRQACYQRHNGPAKLPSVASEYGLERPHLQA